MLRTDPCSFFPKDAVVFLWKHSEEISTLFQKVLCDAMNLQQAMGVAYRWSALQETNKECWFFFDLTVPSWIQSALLNSGSLLTAYQRSQKEKVSKGTRKVESNLDFDDLISAHIHLHMTQIIELQFAFSFSFCEDKNSGSWPLTKAASHKSILWQRDHTWTLNRSYRTWLPSSLLFRWLSCYAVSVLFMPSPALLFFLPTHFTYRPSVMSGMFPG